MNSTLSELYIPLLQFCTALVGKEGKFCDFPGSPEQLAQQALAKMRASLNLNRHSSDRISHHLPEREKNGHNLLLVSKLQTKAKYIALDRISLQLLKKVIHDNDFAAWEKIVNFHYDMLLVKCHGLIQRFEHYPGEAKDLANETFIKSYLFITTRNLSPDHYRSLSSWFQTIAKNRARDEHRRNRRWSSRECIMGIDGDQSSKGGEIAAAQALDPRKALMNKEDQEQINRKIFKFSTITKNIVLSIKAGKNQEIIAKELSITLDSLKYRFRKAKRMLRSLFTRNTVR